MMYDNLRVMSVDMFVMCEENWEKYACHQEIRLTQLQQRKQYLQIGPQLLNSVWAFDICVIL